MPVLLAALAFVLMEPVAYLAHRFVMHGRGRRAAWHVPHHQAPTGAHVDANDLYPVVMAVVTITLMAVGSTVGAARSLLWIGAGVTAYGAAYLFVHDLYIHRRFGWIRFRAAPLERLREAHRIHHLWGGEPYGFLFPLVPAHLRAKAATVARDPLATLG